MALKDWKRTINKTYHTEFINKKHPQVGIRIVDFEYVSYKGGFAKSGYVVKIREQDSSFATRHEFETRADALTFAKSYMRSH